VQAGYSAKLAGPLHIGRIVKGGHHDYWNGRATRPPLDPFKELETVVARHIDVREDQKWEAGFLIAFQPLQQVLRFDAISHAKKPAPANDGRDGILQQEYVILVVIHDQHCFST
jgi:hypothetical protein